MKLMFKKTTPTDIPEERAGTRGDDVMDHHGDVTPAGDHHGDVTPAGDHHGDVTPAGDHYDDVTPASDPHRSWSSSSTLTTVSRLSSLIKLKYISYRARSADIPREREQTTLKSDHQAGGVEDLKGEEPSSESVYVTPASKMEQGKSRASLASTEEDTQFEVSETSPFRVKISSARKNKIKKEYGSTLKEETTNRVPVMNTTNSSTVRIAHPIIINRHNTSTYPSPICQCCSNCYCECCEIGTEDGDRGSSTSLSSHESGACNPLIRMFGFLPFVGRTTPEGDDHGDVTPEGDHHGDVTPEEDHHGDVTAKEPFEDRITEVNLVIRSRAPPEQPSLAPAPPVKVNLRVTMTPGEECEIVKTGAGVIVTEEDNLAAPPEGKYDVFSFKGMLGKLTFAPNISASSADKSSPQRSITPTEDVTVDKTPEESIAEEVPDMFERDRSPECECYRSNVMTQTNKKKGVKERIKRALNMKKSARKLRDRYKSQDSLG